ncbi:MAG: hypothetical protein HYX49_12295 [Chloroflexi bacterium]|nr:hypothetical protein [Chloroflexota bacterium]
MDTILWSKIRYAGVFPGSHFTLQLAPKRPDKNSVVVISETAQAEKSKPADLNRVGATLEQS